MPKACPSDKILNPASGRCVSRTGKIGRALLGAKPAAKKASPKPAAKKAASKPAAKKTPVKFGAPGCVQISASNSTPSQWKKYSTRKSPPYPANECPEGMVQQGNDGNNYVVSAPNAKGVKRWQLCKPGSWCGPQRGGRQQRGARQQRAGDNTGCYTQCNGYTGQAFADCYHDCMN